MSTELIVALTIAALTAAGVYLVLRARTFELVVGLALLGYAVNLLIFAMGRLRVDAAPIVATVGTPTLALHVDPLPQALVLTAIVIGFAMSALLLVVAMLSQAHYNDDHVDGMAPGQPSDEEAER